MHDRVDVAAGTSGDVAQRESSPLRPRHDHARRDGELVAVLDEVVERRAEVEQILDERPPTLCVGRVRVEGAQFGQSRNRGVNVHWYSRGDYPTRSTTRHGAILHQPGAAAHDGQTWLVSRSPTALVATPRWCGACARKWPAWSIA